MHHVDHDMILLKNTPFLDRKSAWMTSPAAVLFMMGKRDVTLARGVLQNGFVTIFPLVFYRAGEK